MSGRRLRRAAALLLAAALAAGCDGDAQQEPEADASTTPAVSSPGERPRRAVERPAAPEEGACYRLRFDEAVAPTVSRRSVPCTEEHTSQTFLVGRLDLVVGGHLVAVDSDRVQEQVSTTCPQRLADLVGGSEEQQRLSMLRAVWFTPTLEESDRGADWFRCDVIAVARAGALAPLAERMQGVLATEDGRARFGMCGTAEPGTDDFRRVVCSAPHSWRAIATVPFPAGDYPGEGEVRTAGETPCEDAGRAVADDPLSFRWGYEWPTREQWQAGQTWGRCWAPA